MTSTWKRLAALAALGAFVACKSAQTTAASDAAPAVSASIAAVASATTNAPPAMVPPPASWWTTTPTAGPEKTPGAARFTANELVFVPHGKRANIQAATLLSGDGKRWEWSRSRDGQTIHCTLDEASLPHASFECTSGGKREAFALAPIADAKRTAELDAVVERNRPAKDACARAEACGPKVFALVGSGQESFNADRELGNPRSPQMCAKALDGLRSMVQTLGREMPAECK